MKQVLTWEPAFFYLIRLCVTLRVTSRNYCPHETAIPLHRQKDINNIFNNN